MTRFKIGDSYLDLAEDTNIQIVRKNEIFAFDSMECERSVSFDIPATANNNTIMQLSNDYHGTGDRMRVKIAATMIIGLATYDGILYVTQYDCSKGAYKCVFVFGQLLGLQALKNAGKIAEIGLQTAEYIDSSSTVYAANSAFTPDVIWGRVKYAGVQTDLNGSVSVAELVELINTQAGLPQIDLTGLTDISGLRIIKGKMSGYDYTSQLAAEADPEETGQPDTTPPANPYNILTFDSDFFSLVSDYFGLLTVFDGTTTQQYWNIQGLRVSTPIKITFPSDMSVDWFLQKGAVTGGASGFYGDHWWEQGAAPNDPPITHGAGLGGRTIEFAAGDEFYLVNVNDFVNTSSGGLVVYGWQFGQGRTFPYDFAAQIQGDERFYLRDNLPDVTPLELCKIIAAVTGTVIRYDAEDERVWFDDLQAWYTADPVLIKDVISKGTLERKFADYAQRNIIRYDSGTEQDKAYTISNENLEAEKELQVIPLSSGIIRAMADGFPAIGLEDEQDTLSGTDTNNEYLQQVEIVKNSKIQEFCDQSTRLTLDCLMNVLQYARIDPQTLFQYDGVLWGWLDVQWADGKAKITLAKFEKELPKSNWIPLMLNCYSDAELIESYGNLFATYAIAPERFGAGSATEQGYRKVGAFALSKSVPNGLPVMTTNTGYVKVYEIDETTGDILQTVTAYRATTKINWQSNTSYKHIVLYNTLRSDATLHNSADAISYYIMWIITTNVIYQNLTSAHIIGQVHWWRNSISLGYNKGSLIAPLTLSMRSSESILWLPDNWDPMWFRSYPIATKIRLSKKGILKSGSSYGDMYRISAAIKQVYLPQNLGEVTQCGLVGSYLYEMSVSTNDRGFTLHVPNQGNAEDNANLITALRNAGWTYVYQNAQRITIALDYDETVPENPYL